jgi:hypothetical protein
MYFCCHAEFDGFDTAVILAPSRPLQRPARRRIVAVDHPFAASVPAGPASQPNPRSHGCARLPAG